MNLHYLLIGDAIAIPVIYLGIRLRWINRHGGFTSLACCGGGFLFLNTTIELARLVFPWL